MSGNVGNELRIGRITGIGVAFKPNKEGELVTRIGFDCRASPQDIAVLMQMQKDRLVLNAVLYSDQKELPFGDKK